MKEEFDFSKRLQESITQRQLAEVQEELLVKQALNSSNPMDIIKARNWVDSKYYSSYQKEDEEIKSIQIDPLNINHSFGYKHKVQTISYDVLRAMGTIPIVNAIIETRKEQVLNFCTPLSSKSTDGFVIRKKEPYYGDKSTKKAPTKAELKKMEYITEFIMNCGERRQLWDTSDSFDMFVRKITDDSLKLDQATFEVPSNRMGVPTRFLATDGATFRISTSYNDPSKVSKDKLIKGIPPAYVQVIQSKVEREFYPWEMCFGIRNPSTNIYSNNYGRSELEVLVQTITDILNASAYNSNYFKVGSNPGGILTYKGSINRNSLDEFRQSWNSQVTGVMNHHRIPVLNGENFQWVQTHQTNREMEYQQYLEFLITVACSVFKIDPSEVNFTQSSTKAPMFGEDKEKSLEFSRVKGLKPYLKKLQDWLNRFIVQRIDPDYELVFKGVDEEDEQRELDNQIKLVTNIQTVDEIREERGLDPLPDGMGEMPLNPMFLQMKQMAQMGDPNSNGYVDGEEDGETQSPFSQYDPEQEEEEEPQQFSKAQVLDLISTPSATLEKGSTVTSAKSNRSKITSSLMEELLKL